MGGEERRYRWYRQWSVRLRQQLHESPDRNVPLSRDEVTMNKKEWQREKQKDIALLVVGLVGTLLGSVLIYYLWYTGWFYHLSVESALSSFDETEIEALFGVVLLLQFLSAMFLGFLRVQIDLRCEREYREKPPEPPDESSGLYEWPNSKAAGKDP